MEFVQIKDFMVVVEWQGKATKCTGDTAVNYEFLGITPECDANFNVNSTTVTNYQRIGIAITYNEVFKVIVEYWKKVEFYFTLKSL